MFQYALGRHLALKNETELMVDTTYFDQVQRNSNHFVKREYDLNIFDIEVKKLEPKTMNWLPHYSPQSSHRLKHKAKSVLNLYKYINDYEVVRETKYFACDKDVLKAGSNTYLIGYWQNEKYFSAIEDQLRSDFRFQDTFDDSVYELASEISEVRSSVCLNIRRTDFVNNPIHGFVGLDYIFNALAYLKTKIDLPRLYVFSDEIEWCRENLRFDVPCFFVGHNFAGPKFSSYLYLMTRCHHFIIPNSTFGWWAAWLSENPGKMIVAPKQWVNYPGLDPTNIIPQGWIGL